MFPQVKISETPKLTALARKFETINFLLTQLEHYKPIYSGSKEADRLHHYRDVICEDLTYIVESLIKGDRLLPNSNEGDRL
jgi:hypothetical protein